MQLILIPGFWLDASSWDAVVPALTGDGHQVTPLTLPGLDPGDDDRAAVGLGDQVAAVVAAIDRHDDPVVLVGHSAASAIAHAAMDARPDRVARVIHVDAVPPGAGAAINDGLPVVDGVIPLPDWSLFDAEDLTDLDDRRRAALRARAVPQPARVARDPVVLTDERRYAVPATVIACANPSALLRRWIAQDHPYVAELAALRDVGYVDLPTGHWPQFTAPDRLAEVILQAVAQDRPPTR